MAPPTLTNGVNPLTWYVPIVNPNGTPTDAFMRLWQEQFATNAKIPDLTTAKGVSAALDLISAVRGALLYRGATTWLGLPPGGANQFLISGGAGADPLWAAVPLNGGTTGQVLTKTSAADYVFNWQTPSAPASALDDGTNFYLAMQDAAGQLVLDVSGAPVFALEVLPAAALPPASSTAFGAVKVDNTTIASVLGVIGTIAQSPTGLFAVLSADASVTANTFVKALCDTLVFSTVGAQYSAITGKFTPTKAGKYLVWGSVQGSAATPPAQAAIMQVNKNTSTTIAPGIGVTLPYSSGATQPSFGMGVVDMNGTTDFLELYGQVVVAAGTTKFVGTQGNTYFGVLWLGP